MCIGLIISLFISYLSYKDYHNLKIKRDDIEPDTEDELEEIDESIPYIPPDTTGYIDGENIYINEDYI